MHQSRRPHSRSGSASTRSSGQAISWSPGKRSRSCARRVAGGSIVVVASKNALVAGKNAAAYSSAKAAELHLARCLAEEGGPAGIRVNTINPDAVLQGSRIWDSSWREERAAAYGIEPNKLEEHYRKRTVLGVDVLPEDVAEAVLHFCSEARSGKHEQRSERRWRRVCRVSALAARAPRTSQRENRIESEEEGYARFRSP